MNSQGKRPSWAIALGLFVGIFGLLTLKSGGEVLFIDGAGRAMAGNYQPYVVWFNFLAGFAYLAGSAGLFLWRSWITSLSSAIAALTIIVFAILAVHIQMGGTFEDRTLVAMTIRALIWLAVAFAVRGKFD